MKTIILTSLAAALTSLSIAQTTATDFTANDCAGTSHTLFADLDAGKVVVMVWVMPCSACISPAKSAYTEVQNYTSANPGRIVYYLSNEGNNTCSSLNSWATTNAINTNSVKFATTTVDQTGYGTAGMPKVVVLGGSSHTIYFNQNSGVNTTNFKNAIDQALLAPSNANVGFDDNKKTDFSMVLFPNPVSNNKTTLSYTLTKNADVKIDVYNTLGALVKSISLEKASVGKHETEINLEELSVGNYFIKLNSEGVSKTQEFSILR